MNKYRHMSFIGLLAAYREKIKATYAYGATRGYNWDYQVYLIGEMEKELHRRLGAKELLRPADSEAEAIIREIADLQPFQPRYADGEEYNGDCVFCGHSEAKDYAHAHTPGCLHLRARKWCEEHPAAPQTPDKGNAGIPDTDAKTIEAVRAALTRRYGTVIGKDQALNIAYTALVAARCSMMGISCE